MQKIRDHKTGLLIIAMLINTIVLSAQQRITSFKDQQSQDTLQCSYNIVNGKLNGNYVSYYHNGNKKSEGELVNGYRTGRWIVWDSTGRKRMERVYQNPFEYTRVFPAVPNEGPIPLLMENKYKLTYDSNGIVKYDLLKAESAVWRHKFWRYAEPVNNELLFINNWFFNLLKKMITTGKIEVYDTVDDRFSKTLQQKETENILRREKMQLVALEIKEEHIFDMDRMVSEYRILGICPIVKIDGRTEKLFWAYYPDLRKNLGKEKISQKTTNRIKTLDDLFIFREFASVIIKSTIDNPYDLFLKNYRDITAKDINVLQEELELTIIESENNIWISLTK